jgi:hypothetical protein
LPSQQRERLFRGFQAAAALLMLHQLAGKAARDGYFLTWFGPAHLPEMVAAAAALSVLMSYLAARLFAWRSPARTLPYAFFVSGVLQIGEWLLLPVQPRIASVLVYLHTFGLGAVLFSGFWSMLSEEFDPREAKRKIGRISAAGTVGGLAGGLLAERLVAWFQAGSLLLLLSLAHFACGMVLLRLARSSSGAKEPRRRLQSPHPAATPSEEPRYLRTLAALVMLAAVSASLLDFAFKFSATAHFGKGPGLVRFFALFYTGSSLLTFLLQSLVTNKSLESLGLGKTMAALPATTAAGSFLALLFPGIGVMSAVRGAEAGVRNSLFKSGYEVCFTPLPAAQKRRIKTIVDVGAERSGDFTGSVIAKMVLRLAVQPASWILTAAAVLAAMALALVSLVDRAYVKALARSLMHRGAELDLSGSLDLTTKTAIARSGLGPATAPLVPASMAPRAAAGLAGDPALLQVALLRSKDAAAVRNAVASADAGHPLVAAQLIQLLGSREAGAEVLARLQPVAERWVGLLCDCLTGTGQDFEVRRKIPGLLAGVPHQRAIDGLLLGLSDERFEVRAQCSRALLRLKRAKPELRIGREVLLAAVERELSAGMLFGEGQRLMENESEVFGVDGLDEFLKERSHAGLQHVFSLLALEYPEGPLLMAFRALRMEDRHLRATALEYLETILPAKTRQLLWQVVGEQPPAAEHRQPHEILDDLMKASATVMFRLKSPE